MPKKIAINETMRKILLATCKQHVVNVTYKDGCVTILNVNTHFLHTTLTQLIWENLQKYFFNEIILQIVRK